jgi:hypothetical protein
MDGAGPKASKKSVAGNDAVSTAAVSAAAKGIANTTGHELASILAKDKATKSISSQGAGPSSAAAPAVAPPAPVAPPAAPAVAQDDIPVVNPAPPAPVVAAPAANVPNVPYGLVGLVQLLGTNHIPTPVVDVSQPAAGDVMYCLGARTAAPWGGAHGGAAIVANMAAFITVLMFAVTGTGMEPFFAAMAAINATAGALGAFVFIGGGAVCTALMPNMLAFCDLHAYGDPGRVFMCPRAVFADEKGYTVLPDIDVFFCGTDEDAMWASILQLSALVPYVIGMHRTRSTLTLVRWGCANIQFVLRIANTLVSCIANYDMFQCQLAFTGDGVYATPGALRALTTRTIVLTMANRNVDLERFKRNKLFKYIMRGFAVSILNVLRVALSDIADRLRSFEDENELRDGVTRTALLPTFRAYGGNYGARIREYCRVIASATRYLPMTNNDSLPAGHYEDGTKAPKFGNFIDDNTDRHVKGAATMALRASHLKRVTPAPSADGAAPRTQVGRTPS